MKQISTLNDEIFLLVEKWYPILKSLPKKRYY